MWSPRPGPDNHAVVALLARDAVLPGDVRVVLEANNSAPSSLAPVWTVGTYGPCYRGVWRRVQVGLSLVGRKVKSNGVQ